MNVCWNKAGECSSNYFAKFGARCARPRNEHGKARLTGLTET
ncbi:MAG: hypothetical protein HW409_1051, partial [candidate division NC10 bacterium]|nr:hypothetical protein [candidate division NC10 bacterium]